MVFLPKILIFCPFAFVLNEFPLTCMSVPNLMLHVVDFDNN